MGYYTSLLILFLCLAIVLLFGCFIWKITKKQTAKKTAAKTAAKIHSDYFHLLEKIAKYEGDSHLVLEKILPGGFETNSKYHGFLQDEIVPYLKALHQLENIVTKGSGQDLKYFSPLRTVKHGKIAITIELFFKSWFANCKTIKEAQALQACVINCDKSEPEVHEVLLALYNFSGVGNKVTELIEMPINKA